MTLGNRAALFVALAGGAVFAGARRLRGAARELGNLAGFLAKPFTAETLCGTVRRILDGRAQDAAKG